MGSAFIASPYEKYGGSLASTTKATSDATAISAVAPAPTPSLAGFLNPDDPAFWFAAVAALGVALMAYSTVVPA